MKWYNFKKCLIDTPYLIIFSPRESGKIYFKRKRLKNVKSHIKVNLDEFIKERK